MTSRDPAVALLEAAAQADVPPPALRIGEAALATGVSERTLRYYEELGLLAPAGHSPGGTRRYGEIQLARVRRIRELQELLGLNLDEIKSILSGEDRFDALRSAWERSEDPGERRAIVLEYLELARGLHDRVAAKFGEITRFLSTLEGKIERCESLLAEMPER